MESGGKVGQESGRVDPTGDSEDWPGRLQCERPPRAERWEAEDPAAGGPDRAARLSARVRRPAGARSRRQFAEAFYLMVMASDLRERARALGRRYGMDAMEVRAEILRYIDDLSSGGARPGS